MSRRILWASDHPRFHTGYGTIGQALLPRWAQEHEVGVLGWHAPAAASSQDSDPWTLFPGGDWEAGRLAEVLQQFQPEVLITLGNLSMLASVPEGRADWAGVWVGYFPIEGSPLPSWRLRLVQDMDRAVTFTRYAVAALCQAGFEGPVDCLPLGVDPDVFRPLPDRADRRSAGGLADRFVVGCVARNQPRKQFPILLRAFARFAREREEAFLYLHTDPDDVGWDLIELGQRYGIADRLGFTAELACVLGVSGEELNEIYNLFDVFALPSMAEGFGLPLLEAMAAGVPVVTTDYAAGAELVRGRGALIRVAQWVTGDGHNTDLALADEDHLVNLLEHLYAHPEERDRLARTGQAYAEEWTWERCHAAWESLLEELPGAAEARRRRPVRAVTLRCFDDLEKVYLAAENALVTLHERYPQAALTFQTASRHHRLVEVCAASAGIALRIAPPLAPPSQGGDCGLRIADCGNWEIRKSGNSEIGKLGSWEAGELVSVDLGEAPRAALWEQWAAACGGPLTRRPRRLVLPVEEQAAALAFLRAQGWQPGDILVGALGEETGLRSRGNWAAKQGQLGCEAGATGQLGNWATGQLGCEAGATGQLGNWATGQPSCKAGSRLPNFLISQFPNFLISQLPSATSGTSRTVRLVWGGPGEAPEGVINAADAGDSLAQVAVWERCHVLIAGEGWGSAVGNALGVPLVVPTSQLPLPIPLSPALSEFVILHAEGTRDEGRGTKDEGRGTKDEGRGTRDEGDLWTGVVDAVAELLSPPKARGTVRRVDHGRVPPGQERLSIIMLTCNHAPEQLASTQCCLDAVRGFTARPFELIVVDNGSDEETVAWLRPQPDLRVRFLPENRGVITGRNLGASLARYEYLVFLDNDQYVRPGWDEELLRFLQGLVVLAGVEQWHCRPEGGVCPTWQRDLLTYVGAGGMIIERTVFAELGGFDELFSPAYAEDPDLCWRAQERGYDFAWCRKAIIDHAGHLTLGRPTEQVVEHLRRLRSRWASRFAAV